MAENNEIINDIFKPSKKGFLGSGIYGVTYKGSFILLFLCQWQLLFSLFIKWPNGKNVSNTGSLYYPNLDKIQVAMKFTHFKKKIYAEKEYEIYSYLYAIDNPEKERYGIPTVYYYGTWRCTVMMAISLLDSVFNKKHEIGNLNVLDALIICKEFVSRTANFVHVWISMVT